MDVLEVIHIYHDGSRLLKTTAKNIILIDPWKGQRIIDAEHIKQIAQSIKSVKHLDKDYKVISYTDDCGETIKRLVDGQHRAAILKHYFVNNPLADDFIVTYTEKRLVTEEEAIEYFTVINNSKPIKFEEDPELVKNKRLVEVLRHFNKKVTLIRLGNSRAPYLSSDQVRAWLHKYTLEDLIAINDRFLTHMVARSLNPADPQYRLIMKALELEFALGVDKGWMK
jgi:hypothetical protein